MFFCFLLPFLLQQLYKYTFYVVKLDMLQSNQTYFIIDILCHSCRIWLYLSTCNLQLLHLEKNIHKILQKSWIDAKDLWTPSDKKSFWTSNNVKFCASEVKHYITSPYWTIALTNVVISPTVVVTYRISATMSKLSGIPSESCCIVHWSSSLELPCREMYIT